MHLIFHLEFDPEMNGRERWSDMPHDIMVQVVCFDGSVTDFGVWLKKALSVC